MTTALNIASSSFLTRLGC